MQFEKQFFLKISRTLNEDSIIIHRVSSSPDLKSELLSWQISRKQEINFFVLDCGLPKIQKKSIVSIKIIISHTTQNSQNKQTKISDLETNIFELKRWSFYFEILVAPSEIPANLPGQFSLSGQLFLHWAAATLKGLVGFQNKKIQTTFHPHFQLKNVGFMI